MMACDYRCPWCSEEIEDQDYWEQQPEDDYTVECPNCEREFEVSYYLDPVFSVSVPEELKDCPCECDAWNRLDECCGYGTSELAKRNISRALAGLPEKAPMAGCPLGHGEKLGGDA